MHGIALCVALLAPFQGTTSEYTFKHVRATHFLRSGTLEALSPGIQISKSLDSPPLTGSWVYLDEKRNRLVFYSRDDSAAHLPTLMADFDVKPMELQMTVGLERPEWGLGLTGTINTPNNQAAIFGSKQLGASFEIRPRMNNDGTVTIQIMMTTLPELEKSHCMIRLDSFGTVKLQILNGQAAFIKGPKSRSGEKIMTPPTSKAWNPFKLELTVLHK